jgi:phosphoserine aminotransferase
MGPAGITIVVIHENLLGNAKYYVPSVFNYSILSKTKSMFNTPPTFPWYLSGIVFKWLKEKGGLDKINRLNQEKSDLLYRVIDNSDIYRNIVGKKNRSRMNIPFFLPDKSMERLFLDNAVKYGLYGLKGHPVIGGIRASLYNAMPIDGVKTLVEFMTSFESTYG